MRLDVSYLFGRESIDEIGEQGYELCIQITTQPIDIQKQLCQQLEKLMNDQQNLKRLLDRNWLEITSLNTIVRTMSVRQNATISQIQRHAIQHTRANPEYRAMVMLKLSLVPTEIR